MSQIFLKNAIKLSFSNEKVATDNFESLKELGHPIACISAIHNNAKDSSLPPDDMGGLYPKLFLSEGARVMLTRNIWTEVGLCNGSIGTVFDIIYNENTFPPSMPITVIVEFDKGYEGPSLFPGKSCVPIVPVLSISDSMGSSFERQQFPLKLSWAITIHKSQGLTLDSAFIDFGQSESSPGLAYVALSRVKKLSDVAIQPVTLERLHAVKKSSG